MSCIPDLSEDEEIRYALFIEHYLLKRARTLAEYRDGSTLNDRVSAVMQLIREQRQEILNLKSSSDNLKRLLENKSQVLWFVITILSDKEIKDSKFLNGFTVRFKPEILKILADAKVMMKNKLGKYLYRYPCYLYSCWFNYMAANSVDCTFLLIIEVKQKAAVIGAEARFAGRKAVPTPPVSKPLAGMSFFLTGDGWKSAGLKNQAHAKRLVRVLGGTVLGRSASNTDAKTYLLRGSGQVKLHDIPGEHHRTPDWLKNQCESARVDITPPVCISLQHT